MPNNRMAVVLFSGGLDSLAALLWARRQYKNVLALYCDVKHRYNTKEINAVRQICEKINQKYIIDTRLDLSANEAPKELNSVIPYRNSFFILMAASYLPPEGGDVILQNVITGESSTWDRRQAFNDGMQTLLNVADPRRVRVIAPHRGMTKGEIVKSLISYKECTPEIINLTVGCYSKEHRNCGRCNSCLRSFIALDWAGVPNWISRYDNDPREWKEGIENYIRKMENGEYDGERTAQTFAVLRKYGLYKPKKVIAVDIDGVLACTPKELENLYQKALDADIAGLKQGYINASPNVPNIVKLNKLYDAGNIIVLYTARYEEDRAITEAWLKKYGVKYHQLVMGKIGADIYIDDRAAKLEDLV